MLVTVEITFPIGGLQVFNSEEVESVRCSEQIWDAQFKLATGIMQQYADIEFRDVYGRLHKLAAGDELLQALKVAIYVLDSTETRTLLGVYVTDTWSCDGTSDVVTLKCNDYTRNFALYAGDVIGEKLSVMQVINKINDVLTSEAIQIPANETVSLPGGRTRSIRDFLQDCICEDVYFQSETLETIIEALCDRWLLRVYYDPARQQYFITEAW